MFFISLVTFCFQFPKGTRSILQIKRAASLMARFFVGAVLRRQTFAHDKLRNHQYTIYCGINLKYTFCCTFVFTIKKNNGILFFKFCSYIKGLDS